ncbi:hypothetical protein NUW58_g10576 [Xylaria curta]|uniref:Uncharacterized protein n=1 Tax=Xylaria curta TaxID=42375 RepID=A0ACC1MKM5_9PEZI|nr:hypothetical protein NUW58_g10576 [Xylaria curta]
MPPPKQMPLTAATIGLLAGAVAEAAEPAGRHAAARRVGVGVGRGGGGGVDAIPFLQVLAGAEGAPGPGEHGAAERGLLVVPVPQPPEREVLRTRDGVELFWAVERHEEDVLCREGDDDVRDGRRW